ncbi:MAG TPA: response regulator transcription factor [Hyphomicrobiaceae bacterium]|nr:response regulator transcription factor [Hyphomicrobiaceae bacterium]
MARPIRVAVVDPYPIFREAVVQTITRCPELLLVAQGATAADARAAVREAEPDILLIDISIPEGGIEAAIGIAKGGSSCKLVVLTALDDVMSVSKALAAGVKGYILKGVSGTELVAAIKTIDGGLPFVTPDLASRLLTDARGGALLPLREAKLKAALSYREQQILNHVSKGLTNKEIADRLGLTVGTIKHYVTQLFKKMNVRNRLEAIQAAQKSDLT